MNRSVLIGIKGLLIAASCAVGCGSAIAQVGNGAVPLPPSFSESVTSIDLNTGVSSTQSGYGPYDVTNRVATAGTSYTLATEGEASLTINAGSDLAQLASASVIWNFIVYGPPNQSTFVYLQGRGDVKIMKPIGGVSYDGARAMMYGDAFGPVDVNQSTNGEKDFGISRGAFLNTNTVYTINAVLSAFSYPFNNGTTDFVHASFDPVVSLADTSGVYSIALSPVAAVPEPATWAMMIVGFGMIGVAARRRKSVKKTVRFA